jgi:putative CocE/NonD family hydrolase
MSDQTSSNFAEAIEWAASQTWSNGKVGLLGISYFAGSQWRVAVRQPKGLAAIIPWEGMSDYYRDRVRHGGILSNTFIDLWQNRHVNSNQYGVPPNDGSNSVAHMPGNSKRPANPEGTLTPEQLSSNRTDQTIDTAKNKYLDDPYFASRDYNLDDIQVPTLSVPNWGGIILHLRGNVMGYLGAGTKNKWMHFITGRHDLPFYLPEFVKLQKSFLDAFLKDQDDANWKAGPNAPGGVAAVTYTVRKGNPGFNKTDYERTFSTKQASAWPIPGTKYVDYHLTSKKKLSTTLDDTAAAQDFTWQALDGQSVSFSTDAFTQEAEITGHVTLHVTVSVEGPAKDLDLFVTLRHFDSSDKEVFYTGTAGDPVPLTKGWQRLSLRKLVPESEPWLPRRNYLSSDVLPVTAGERYNVPIELWPTNVVVSKGGRLVVEIGPQDQQGTGIFSHRHPQDRSEDVFGGSNVLHVGKGSDSRLVLPFV